MIFLKWLKNLLINNKTRNFIIAVALLLATYLLIVFLTENDNSIRDELPVSNMKNTENNNLESILKDELYIIQNLSEQDEGYEIEIYYPYTTDDKLNSYINTKLERLQRNNEKEKFRMATNLKIQSFCECEL